MSRSREEILKEIAKLKKELDDIPCEFCGKNPIYAKGLCRNCYARLLNRGTCEYAVRKKKEKPKTITVYVPWREKLTQDVIGDKIKDKPIDFDETVDFFVSRLTEREQIVVKKRADGETLKNVAIMIGLSRERARQIYNKSLMKLRKFGFSDTVKIGLKAIKDQDEEKEKAIIEKYKSEIEILSQFDMQQFEISTRAYNCLRRNKVETAGDLYEVFSSGEIKTFRNLGIKTEQELLKILFPLCIKYNISTEPLSRNH